MKKVIKLNGKKVKAEYISDRVFLIPLLKREGFTASEIAFILQMPKEKVLEYLKDC